VREVRLLPMPGGCIAKRTHTLARACPDANSTRSSRSSGRCGNTTSRVCPCPSPRVLPSGPQSPPERTVRVLSSGRLILSRGRPPPNQAAVAPLLAARGAESNGPAAPGRWYGSCSSPSRERRCCRWIDEPRWRPFVLMRKTS
jgi:hypothetical protein